MLAVFELASGGSPWVIAAAGYRQNAHTIRAARNGELSFFKRIIFLSSFFKFKIGDSNAFGGFCVHGEISNQFCDGQILQSLKFAVPFLPPVAWDH